MKKIIVLILILISKPAYSGNNIIFADTKGSSNYLQTHVWGGNFTAPNGEKFHLGNYYKSQNTEINLKTNILYKINSNLLIFPVNFDNGYKSNLLEVKPIYSMGFLISKELENLKFIFGFNNAFKIGGSIKEKPCYDKFDREFHCGTGQPWIDYKLGKKIYSFYDDELILRLNYSF